MNSGTQRPEAVLSTGHRPKTLADRPTSPGACSPGVYGRVPLGLPKLFAKNAWVLGRKQAEEDKGYPVVVGVTPVRTFTVAQSWCQGRPCGEQS